MYFVYLLEGCDSRKKYIGYTSNLKRRLEQHNAHQNISTSRERKWKIIYCEVYCEKTDALGREKFLKSGSGWRFLRKQIKHYLEATKA